MILFNCAMLAQLNDSNSNKSKSPLFPQTNPTTKRNKQINYRTNLLQFRKLLNTNHIAIRTLIAFQDLYKKTYLDYSTKRKFLSNVYSIVNFQNLSNQFGFCSKWNKPNAQLKNENTNAKYVHLKFLPLIFVFFFLWGGRGGVLRATSLQNKTRKTFNNSGLMELQN